MSPRAYLVTRFQSDADALRVRADALRQGPPQPGPDAAMSTRMADACADVVAMLTAIPASDDAIAEIEALTALIPLLEQRATASGKQPPVRAVYAGAATRIREVRDAEDRRGDATGGDDADEHDTERDDFDDDEAFEK